MSDHSAHDVKESVKRYLFVFYALLFGTMITVAASYIHFGHRSINIAVALFIATVKAFLVAGYFMHLISEKKLIYSILAFTGFFFAGMMYLTVWSRDQIPVGTIHFDTGASRPAATTQSSH
jgi:cytochrome c oxidase subunit 4